MLTAATVIGYITVQQYKVGSLEDKLELAKADYEIQKLAVGTRDATITSMEANLAKLAAELEVGKKKNEERLAELAARKKELEAWAAKEPEVKYVKIYKKVVPKDVDLSKGKCDDGLKLNEQISEMRYEDL